MRKTLHNSYQKVFLETNLGHRWFGLLSFQEYYIISIIKSPLTWSSRQLIDLYKMCGALKKQIELSTGFHNYSETCQGFHTFTVCDQSLSFLHVWKVLELHILTDHFIQYTSVVAGWTPFPLHRRINSLLLRFNEVLETSVHFDIITPRRKMSVTLVLGELVLKSWFSCLFVSSLIHFNL